ncbi:MAG: tyrosine-type recombinase/integrase [Deltaproteobacteria bacterium]|nr:tyrosine-type recombinase/integrase [Deltaproteobacteria bacterium]
MGGKRTYGSGNIEARGGRFRVRLRMPDGSVAQFGTYATREEADGVLAAASERLAGGIERTSSTTLAELGARWLDERRATHRNAAKDESVWRRQVGSAAIGASAVGTLDARDVATWLKALGQATAVSAITKAGGGAVLRRTERRLSRSVVRQAFKLLRMCLDAALEEGLCATNPARAPEVAKQLRMLRSPTTQEGWTYLTEAEIAAIERSDAIVDVQRLPILFAIYSGLRQGEVFGLRWADVDIDSPSPKMTVRYGFGATPTKSGKVATVPLLPAAVDVLKRWRPIAPPSPRLGLVFPNPDGGCYARGYDRGWADRAYGQGKQRKVLSGIKTRVGITRRVRFHDLRHYADLLVMPMRGPTLASRRGICGVEAFPDAA